MTAGRSQPQRAAFGCWQYRGLKTGTRVLPILLQVSKAPHLVAITTVGSRTHDRNEEPDDGSPCLFLLQGLKAPLEMTAGHFLPVAADASSADTFMSRAGAVTPGQAVLLPDGSSFKLHTVTKVGDAV